jgi:nucleoside-diphosphate-sugar epimerase
MKVLITGSEGRIGRFLVTLLRRQGYGLRGFDVVASGERPYDYTPGDLQIRAGYLYPNDKPGLGIDIDEKLAAHHPIHPNMAQFKAGVVDWTQSRLPDGTLGRP